MKSAWSFIAVALLISACREDSAPSELAVIPLEEIGIEYEAGSDETGTADAVIRHLVDAVLVGDTLAVLDASPPFVKLFDDAGRFAGTRVRRGRGPGEGRRPVAIGRGGARALLVAEQKSLMLVSLDSAAEGGMLDRTVGDDWVLRGATIGCGDRIVSLVTANGWEQPGALMVAPNLQDPPDTLSTLGPIRANSQLAQPAFIDASDEAVAFYTEETDVPRLQVIQCDDRSAASVVVDSLGRQQWFEETATGFALHPSEPPKPAGVAMTPSGLVWAVQVLDGPAGADSLTLVSLIDPDANSGVQRVVALDGWYQILDSEPEGRMVVGAQQPVPRVLTIRTRALLDAIEGRGIERPIRRPSDEHDER